MTVVTKQMLIPASIFGQIIRVQIFLIVKVQLILHNGENGRISIRYNISWK